MKLYRYSKFIKESIKNTTEYIDSICRKYYIDNYTINEDGSVDVDGSVELSHQKLIGIPIKFRNVEGDFDCSNNCLTSLKGSPLYIGGNFSCHDNRLTSLDGGPNSVGGYFYYNNNSITSIVGLPKSLGGILHLTNNNLRDVKGIKDGWKGNIYISDNPVYEIFKLFPTRPPSRYDEVAEYLNEFNVIRDGKVVVLQALEQVFVEMGLDIPEIESIKGYEII